MKPFYKRKRFYVLLGLAVLGLLVWRLRQEPTPQTEEKPHQNHQTVSPRKQVKPLLEQSLSTLEKPDKMISSSQLDSVKEALQIALSYTKDLGEQIIAVEVKDQSFLTNEEVLKVLSSIQGTYDNRLSLTSVSMLQTLVTMFSVHYDYEEDSLQAYYSDSDNVYQFVFKLSRSDKDSLYFVGNYVVGTGQLEMTSMQGQPLPVMTEKGEKK